MNVNLLKWYDMLTPTSPFAAIFFGILFTIIISVTVWLDTKNWRTFRIALATGWAITITGVVLLSAAGYYG